MCLMLEYCYYITSSFSASNIAHLWGTKFRVAVPVFTSICKARYAFMSLLEYLYM
jgi:hypothetical protein